MSSAGNPLNLWLEQITSINSQQFQILIPIDSSVEQAKQEIPKSQRYVNRPALKDIFTEIVADRKPVRDKNIREAVERYGYSQREVADHLGMHYSTISGIINGRNRNIQISKT